MKTVGLGPVFAYVCDALPRAVAELARESGASLRVETRSREGWARIYQGDRLLVVVSRRSDERQTIRVKPKIGGWSHREFPVVDMAVGDEIVQHLIDLLSKAIAPSPPHRIPKKAEDLAATA